MNIFYKIKFAIDSFIYSIGESFFLFWHKKFPIKMTDKNKRYRRLMRLPLECCIKDPDGIIWQHITEKWWIDISNLTELKGYQLKYPLIVVPSKSYTLNLDIESQD